MIESTQQLLERHPRLRLANMVLGEVILVLTFCLIRIATVALAWLFVAILVGLVAWGLVSPHADVPDGVWVDVVGRASLLLALAGGFVGAFRAIPELSGRGARRPRATVAREVAVQAVVSHQMGVNVRDFRVGWLFGRGDVHTRIAGGLNGPAHTRLLFDDLTILLVNPSLNPTPYSMLNRQRTSSIEEVMSLVDDLIVCDALKHAADDDQPSARTSTDLIAAAVARGQHALSQVPASTLERVENELLRAGSMSGRRLQTLMDEVPAVEPASAMAE